MPTGPHDSGYDHFLVLPKGYDEGRVVLAFQVKDGVGGNFDSQEDSVAREARWGRHQVRKGRASKPEQPNAFRQQLQARMASARGTTDVIFVLVTPTKVGAGPADGRRVPKSTEAADVMTAAGVQPDEGRLSLEGMQGWCPTVAYAALASLKLRSVASPREEPAESP